MSKISRPVSSGMPFHVVWSIRPELIKRSSCWSSFRNWTPNSITSASDFEWHFCRRTSSKLFTSPYKSVYKKIHQRHCQVESSSRKLDRMQISWANRWRTCSSFTTFWVRVYLNWSKTLPASSCSTVYGTWCSSAARIPSKLSYFSSFLGFIYIRDFYSTQLLESFVSNFLGYRWKLCAITAWTVTNWRRRRWNRYSLPSKTLTSTFTISMTKKPRSETVRNWLNLTWIIFSFFLNCCCLQR